MDEHSVISTETLAMSCAAAHHKHAFSQIFDVEPFPDDMTGLEQQIDEFSVGAPIPQPAPALNSIAALILALLMMVGVLLWRNHSVSVTIRVNNHQQP